MEKTRKDDTHKPVEVGLDPLYARDGLPDPQPTDFKKPEDRLSAPTKTS